MDIKYCFKIYWCTY